tara:strand:- start:107 stop:655 length:549 start_codon:yes stop_codon:yes gene_type:complete
MKDSSFFLSLSPYKLCIQHLIMYVQTVNSELHSRIENRNNCNYFSNCFSRDLIELFTPFLNKKVRKISGYGGWLKSIEKLIEPWQKQQIVGFGEHDKIMIYASYTSLICRVQTWDKASRKYASNEIYFGRFDDTNGELTQLSEPTKYRIDLTAEELIEAQNQHNFHQSKMTEAAAMIRNFQD